MSGLVIRHGKVVAEWGETRKVDMTFSVSKSFLSTVVGVAYDRGLIGDLEDSVIEYMPTEEKHVCGLRIHRKRQGRE